MFFVPIFVLTIISSISFMCSAMDPVQKNQSQKKNARIKELFASIISYKYEETTHLISQSPRLIDTQALYENGFFSETITPIHLAALIGNSVALENMLKVSQKSVNAVTPASRNMPLHFACNERVAQLLLENGATVNQRNERECTPLYEALYGHHHEHEPYFDVAYCLLKNSADIDQQGRYGETVLHKATQGNISSKYAHFLLANGADGDRRDNQGHTPFDDVMEHAVQRNIFQRFGYSYYWVQNINADPFELLKNDPQFFFETSEVVGFIRDLYITARKQEEKSPSSDNRLDVITIKVCKGSKLYIFKKPSFADLESYFGVKAIGCVKTYLKNQFDSAQSSIARSTNAFFKVKFDYDINDVDEHNDSLLHTAVQCENNRAIQWLLAGHMHYKIDCMIKNNQGKIAFDYLIPRSNNGPCLAIFLDSLIQRFFEKDLDQKTDQFVFQRLMYWNYMSDEGRKHYFLKALRDRPDACSFFFKKGIDVNGVDKSGMSPLLYAIQPWQKKTWEQVPPIHKYNIRELLLRGAIVTEAMLQSFSGYLRDLLQGAYDKQK